VFGAHAVFWAEHLTVVQSVHDWTTLESGAPLSGTVHCEGGVLQSVLHAPHWPALSQLASAK